MTEDIKSILARRKPEIDAVIERYIPRKNTKESIEFVYGKPRFKYDLETATRSINDLVWDFLDRGGKRWRPALFLMTAEAIGGKKALEKVKEFVLVPELVHNGTIIVDDIEDNSDMRRGKPCLHKIYGVDLAVNAGNAIYFIPLLAFKKNKDKFEAETLVKAYEIYAQEMINVSLGQGFDIYWHKGLKENVSEDEYLQMCAYKTGTLARMSAKLGALLAGGTDAQIEAAGRYAEVIGVAFQIQDDLLNLIGEEDKYGKEIGGDISEGKRTLMVIHTLNKATAEDAKKLKEILNSHTKEQSKINEAIEILKKYDSLDYAKEKARVMVKEAWSEVDKTFPESEAKQQLHAFAVYLVEREL
ncbi:MAG: polyprenyl synthetase family protein [Candidatus Micrarchaeota archaeon]